MATLQTATQRLFTVEEAAKYQACSVWTARKLVWNGTLPHVRVGRLVRVDRADLDRWIEGQKVTNGRA